MGSTPFLAMTAAEIAGNAPLPPKIAWMACHFSPYGPGLTNLPKALPAVSLLMLDDATPLRNHDPERIREQLCRCAETFRCSGILLDFQRPVDEQTAALAAFLSDSLPCPMAVSHWYAESTSCALCIPPVPPSEIPSRYFSRWPNRELWLELSMEGEQITVTENGAAVTPLPFWEEEERDFYAGNLLCHYRQEVRDDAVVFSLYRTAEDAASLLNTAKSHGVTNTVGLYQEYFQFNPEAAPRR